MDSLGTCWRHCQDTYLLSETWCSSSYCTILWNLCTLITANYDDLHWLLIWLIWRLSNQNFHSSCVFHSLIKNEYLTKVGLVEEFSDVEWAAALDQLNESLKLVRTTKEQDPNHHGFSCDQVVSGDQGAVSIVTSYNPVFQISFSP